MWLHASPNFIAAGTLVSPPAGSRVPRWPGAQQAQLMGWYRPDRVCVFWSDEGVPVKDHVGRFDFVTDTTYIYEVEPIGELEADPAPGGHDSWRCCPAARVLSCHRSPSR